uniref:Uncharacterized protein n=1 Tax=Neobodo designis TaxID=312471 RepID=A0A7S1R2A4_NEODS|mmetsp:Transcript_7222/g.22606  ORF Transcript_7222/g.22606 Transcript_7222/m.22606 type:complete len:980 (+) Transcript_7222:33-2972(+)
MENSPAEREIELLWVALSEERQVVAMKNRLVSSLQVTVKQQQQRIADLEDECRSFAVRIQSANARPERQSAGTPSVASSSTASAPPSEDSFAAPMPQANGAQFNAQMRIDNDRLAAQLRTLTQDRKLVQAKRLIDAEDLEEFSRSGLAWAESTGRAEMLRGFAVAAKKQHRDAGEWPPIERIRTLLTGWLENDPTTQKLQLLSGSLERPVALTTPQVMPVEQLSESFLELHWSRASAEFRAASQSVKRESEMRRFVQNATVWTSRILAVAHDRCCRISETPLHMHVIPALPNPPRDESASLRIAEMGHRIRALEERTSEKTRMVVAQAREIEQLRRQLLAMPENASPPARPTTPPARLSVDVSEIATGIEETYKCMWNALLLHHRQLLDSIRAAQRLCAASQPLSSIVQTALMVPKPADAEVSTGVAEAHASEVAGIQRQHVASTAALLLSWHESVGHWCLDSLQELAVDHFRDAPESRSVEHVRADIAERSLSLVEAQRDQAATVANWLHTEATGAIRTLSGLVSRVDKALTPATAADRAAPPAEELEAQRKAREAEKVAQQSASKFGAICDALLDQAARVQARLVDVEQDSAVLRRAASEYDTKGLQYRDAATRSAITHRIERDIADDAMRTLHQHLLEERSQACRSMKVLGAGISQRNASIRRLTREAREFSEEARANNFLAQKCWAAFDQMAGQLYAAWRRELIQQRLRQLPSAGEIQFVLLVVHAELGVAFGEMMQLFHDSMRAGWTLLQSLHYKKREHDQQMLAASTELVSISRVRRTEREAVDMLQNHAIQLLAIGMSSFREEMQNLAFQLQDTLQSALYSDARSRQSAVEASDRCREAEDRLRVLVEENRDRESHAEAAEARAAELAAKFQRAAAELAACDEARRKSEECSSQYRRELDDSRAECETASQLLAAERHAHQLVRSHEEALERDAADLRVQLERSRTDLQKAEADLHREKDAHRATIRSMSQR